MCVCVCVFVSMSACVSVYVLLVLLQKFIKSEMSMALIFSSSMYFNLSQTHIEKHTYIYTHGRIETDRQYFIVLVTITTSDGRGEAIIFRIS